MHIYISCCMTRQSFLGFHSNQWQILCWKQQNTQLKGNYLFAENTMLGCSMSLKIRFWHPHLDSRSTNCGAVSDVRYLGKYFPKTLLLWRQGVRAMEALRYVQIIAGQWQEAPHCLSKRCKRRGIEQQFNYDGKGTHVRFKNIVYEV